MKPGSASRPFFGVEPVVVDDQGNPEPRGTSGKLCIKKPWPGIMRTTWGDHERFVQTYFSTFKGLYFSGDGCRVDEDGDYWLLGRVDDVINVSGHRLGTAEVESALVSHAAVAEAAVVGCPHDIKGQGIYAYVTLRVGIEPTDELLKELVKHVRKEIGPIATPDVIQWAPGLPKTRSGKIMRRILRKIAENEPDKVGDTSTLADPVGGRRSDRQSPATNSRSVRPARIVPTRARRDDVRLAGRLVCVRRSRRRPATAHSIDWRVAVGTSWLILLAESCGRVDFLARSPAWNKLRSSG